jgi:ADP-heptose:LPS heptosyltransferase
VSAASFFVSNDSLVGHIAALFSIPGVVISSNLLPGRFFPYPLHPSIRVALSPDSCECASRCIRGGRRAARPCLTRVSPELVVSELRNLGVKV